MLEVANWHALTTGILKLALGFLVFLASTVVFDIVHWLLHQLSTSRFAPLRGIGELHAAHHAFLTRDLQIDDSQLDRNIRLHVIPEFMTQLAVSAVLLLYLPLAVVGVAIFVQVLVFVLILRARGKDLNHVQVDRLTAYRPLYFCTPPYHRLHHVHPGAYFSSWIKTFDHLVGTGVDLRDRSFAMIGDGGDFGDELRAQLAAYRGEPIRVLDDVSTDEDALAGAEVFVLAGDPARFDAHMDRIEALTEGRRFPPEVWAVAPAQGFEERGRRLYTDPRFIYRHIAAPPGKGAPARREAKVAFFFIRRGFNWVPRHFSLEMILDFRRFRALGGALPTGQSSTTLS